MTLLAVSCAVATCTAVVLVGARLRPRTIRTARGQTARRSSTTTLQHLRTAWPNRVSNAWPRRSSRRAPSPRAVAEWCDALARRTRSGAALREALITTVPDDDGLRARTDELRLALQRGRSTADALAERASDGGPHLELARHVIETAARLGGPCASSIDHVALVLRQRAADSDERVAQSAQARLSGHVLTAIPLVLLALLVVTDDDVRVVMTSSVGIVCVSVGMVLNVGGWWWMQRLVKVGP